MQSYLTELKIFLRRISLLNIVQLIVNVATFAVYKSNHNCFHLAYLSILLLIVIQIAQYVQFNQSRSALLQKIRHFCGQCCKKKPQIHQNAAQQTNPKHSDQTQQPKDP